MNVAKLTIEGDLSQNIVSEVAVDVAMESKLGDAAVSRVPWLSGVGPPKYQTERVDGWFPQIDPVTAVADSEGEVRCHRPLTELGNATFKL